jgi:hypothetical protein
MRRSTALRARTDASTLFSSERVRTLVETASDEDYRDGSLWYLRAHDHALGLSERYGLTVRQASGIIAALSPQIGWEQNLVIADEFTASGGTASVHVSICTERARAILDDPHADPLDILGGPKVRSFYRNIYRPDVAGPVTIDRHAAAILAGLPTPTYLRTFPKFLERTAVYGLAAAAYRTAARDLGILPHEAQAVAWVRHRRDYAHLYEPIPGL